MNAHILIRSSIHMYVLASWAKMFKNVIILKLKLWYEVNFSNIYIYETHIFHIYRLERWLATILRLLLFGLRSPVDVYDTNKLFNNVACGPFFKCSNHFIQFWFFLFSLSEKVNLIVEQISVCSNENSSFLVNTEYAPV